MKIEHKKIEEIADVIAGQSPPSSSYNTDGKGLPFFQGKADYGEKYPKVRFWCSEPTKISVPNDILISVRAPVGPVNINNLKSCIGRGLTAIRVNKNVSRDYVYFFLKLNELRIAKLGVGSTFTSITQKDVKALLIPIPNDYEDQIRIASILSKAEALTRQREESIRLLDEFLKSTFLEMFGDPVRNEKGWEVFKLKEIAKVKIGPFGSLLHFEDYVENGIPLVNPTHIVKGRIKVDNTLTVSDQKITELSSYRMKIGDIVLGRRGEIGRCAIVTKDEGGFLCGTGSIFLTPSDKLNSTFLHYFISSAQIKKVLESVAKGVTMKNLNSGNLENLLVPLPQVKLQAQFAHIVDKTEALKARYQTSLQELENLYGSLSQKAFKGELNLKGEELAMAAEPQGKYGKK